MLKNRIHNFFESNKVLNFFLKKTFKLYLIILILIGVSLVFQFPNSFYEYLINRISEILKSTYGTKGTEKKIYYGLVKLGQILILSAFFILIYLKTLNSALKKIIHNPETLEERQQILINKMDMIILIALITTAIFLRFINIRQSLWQDEIGVYQSFIKDGVISTIFPKTSTGSHPLMQIIVVFFTKIFGVNEITLRLPILIFSILNIPLIYYVVLKIFNKRSLAIISSIILCFHTYHIYYSFQMRGYNMVVFFTTISIYAFHKILFDNEKRFSVILFLANTCLLYTHLYSLYFIAAQNIILFFMLFSYNKNKKFYYKNVKILINSIIISVIISFLLYLPQLPVIFMNILNSSDLHTEFNWSEHILYVLSSSTNLLAYTDNKLLAIIVFICLTIIFVYTKKSIGVLFLVYTNFLLFFMIMLLPSGSSFFPRYLIPLLPIKVILIAYLINWTIEKKSFVFFSLTSILIIFYLNISAINKTYMPIQDYKSAVTYIKAREKNEYIIVSNSVGKNEIKYYNEQIIPLKNKTQLDSIINKVNVNVYAITTFENMAGRNGDFYEDAKTQEFIEEKFKKIIIFESEFPVTIWQYLPD